MPADLVESLRDLVSSHSKNHYQPMLNLSRQRIGQVMKDAAREVGIDPARAHPHAFRHTYGRNCVLRGVPIPVLQKWLGHSSMVVCPPVQREIDALKGGREGRRSERARKTASILLEIAQHGPQQQRTASPNVMLDLYVTSQPKQNLPEGA